MPGRRPLAPDQHVRIALGARAGVLAIDVVKGHAAAERAVTELALIAPGRPDLVDQTTAVVERGREVRLADWPRTPSSPGHARTSPGSAPTTTRLNATSASSAGAPPTIVCRSWPSWPRIDPRVRPRRTRARIGR